MRWCLLDYLVIGQRESYSFERSEFVRWLDPNDSNQKLPGHPDPLLRTGELTDWVTGHGSNSCSPLRSVLTARRPLQVPKNERP